MNRLDIQERLLALGVQQQVFAKYAQVREAYLSRYIHGLRVPIERAQQIEAALTRLETKANGHYLGRIGAEQLTKFFS